MTGFCDPVRVFCTLEIIGPYKEIIPGMGINSEGFVEMHIEVELCRHI